jgi:deazaflavin-dependent oxidoreductase (nitroreductase family)
MGLAEDLDYRVRPANPVQRATQGVVATRPGSWVASRILPPLDTWVQRLTHDRHSAPSLVVGLPVLDLTTTGRHSGIPRTSHLIAVPYGGTLALIGSNFAREATPGWVHNLEADPRATVSYRGTSVRVVARPATEEELTGVLSRSEEVYPGYRRYQSRITGRRLRVFLLDQQPD